MKKSLLRNVVSGKPGSEGDELRGGAQSPCQGALSSALEAP